MEQGKWIQLMPHVSYLEFQQQTDRPNLGYIFGKKQARRVDAGNSAAHVQQYRQARQAQAAMPPSYTAITHWHWDHTFGMWALRAQTIVTRQTDAKLRSELKTYIAGATVIIVAQRVSTIMDADEILVLDEGRIVGAGTHEELMGSCGVYREIAASQLGLEAM